MAGRKLKLEDRPVIYTFYHGSTEGDDDMLVVWKKKWWDAGWSPIVLSMQNAERHSNYETVLDELPDGNALHSFQWLAVAQAGGGWLADFDVFPLRDFTKDGHSLPNSGKLTIWENVVASLVSGTSDEYTRAAMMLAEHMADQGQFNDMLALVNLQRTYPFGGGFIHRREVLNGRVAQLIDLQAMNKSTECIVDKRAVHFNRNHAELQTIITWTEKWSSCPCSAPAKPTKFEKARSLDDEEENEEEYLRTTSEQYFRSGKADNTLGVVDIDGSTRKCDSANNAHEVTTNKPRRRTISEEYEGLKRRVAFDGEELEHLLEQRAIQKFNNPLTETLQQSVGIDKFPKERRAVSQPVQQDRTDYVADQTFRDHGNGAQQSQKDGGENVIGPILDDEHDTSEQSRRESQAPPSTQQESDRFLWNVEKDSLSILHDGAGVIAGGDQPFRVELESPPVWQDGREHEDDRTHSNEQGYSPMRQERSESGGDRALKGEQETAPMLHDGGQNGGDRAPRGEHVTAPMRQEVGGNEGS